MEPTPGTEGAWQPRILHGLSGAAGQPSTVSRAMRRLGYDARCVSTGSKFEYPADLHLDLTRDPLRAASDFLVKAADEFDVFHFYFRPFYYLDSRRFIFPTAMDLLALRAAGKIVVFHYRGSEVRDAPTFKALSPYNYVEENPNNIFTKFPAATIRSMRDFVDGVSHRVLVPDVELQSYAPEGDIVPRAIDLQDWPHVGVPEGPPLVVHAPSRRGVKGTDHVLRTVETLKAEGLDFEFRLVEGMSHHQAKAALRSAAIVVDQLRIGWHGALAVEAMALGKPVVAYIREDLRHHLGPEPPIAFATPDDVTDVLRSLIGAPEGRRELGQRARAYVERTHDSEVVARQLVEIYRQAKADPRPVAMEAVVQFMQTSYHHTKSAYSPKQANSRGGARAGKSNLWKYLLLAHDEGFRHATRVALRRLLGRRKARARP